MDYRTCYAGEIEAARSTYKLLLTVLAPDLVEAIVQAANFERRHSNASAACKTFEDALEREEGKEGGEPNIASFETKCSQKWNHCFLPKFAPGHEDRAHVLQFHLLATLLVIITTCIASVGSIGIMEGLLKGALLLRAWFSVSPHLQEAQMLDQCWQCSMQIFFYWTASSQPRPGPSIRGFCRSGEVSDICGRQHCILKSTA